MPVSYSNIIVAPVYPECLYGSKRYAVDYAIEIPDSDGTIKRFPEQQRFVNRENAITFARMIDPGFNFTISDLSRESH